jgi:Spherulation-specific family 4
LCLPGSTRTLRMMRPELISARTEIAPPKLLPQAFRVATALGTALLLLTPGGVAAAAQRPKPAPVQLVPQYETPQYDPTTWVSDWATTCSEVSGANGGSYVVANIDQPGLYGGGPGAAPVPAWASVLNNCVDYGRATVLGYVPTNYGEGGLYTLSSIEGWVNDWYSYYRGDIGGIFFDDVSDTNPLTGASNVTFYQTLDSYVHQHEGNNDEVVLNFGYNPGSGWMFNSSNAKNADIVVTFEGPYTSYPSWVPASWESQYPADDFSALVYADNDPTTACSALLKQNLGYLDVTTYYTAPLPSYFSQMVADC